jgi:hypothetical protein
VDYVEKLLCKANRCTFGCKIKRTLNDKTIKCHNKKTLLDFFINRKILALHLINYIDLNGSLHHVINRKCLNYDCSIAIYLTLSMDGPNLSTLVQIAITPIHECDQICPPLSKKRSPLFRNVIEFIHLYQGNDHPYPWMQLNFNHLREWSTLFKNAIEFWLF